MEYNSDQAKTSQNSLQTPPFITRNLTDLLKAKWFEYSLKFKEIKGRSQANNWQTYGSIPGSDF